MITGWRGWQDTGKTAGGLLQAKELIINHGYLPSEFYGNIHVNWPGAHCLTIPQMRAFIKQMVSKSIRHKIIFLDEVDRIFPARFWHNQEQTEALIGLWQDQKLFNQVIYTAHKGTSLDIIMRLITQIEIEPDYDEANNCIWLTVFNSLDGIVYEDCSENVSETIFKDYDRWEIIGSDTTIPASNYELSGRTQGVSSRERLYERAEGGSSDNGLPPQSNNPLFPHSAPSGGALS